MPKELDKEVVYTKTEVVRLIQEAKDEAIEEARKIDEASMRKHNWTATIISMVLGLIALSLFVDGLLRILGIIPPFMDLDVNVIDDIVEKVENDIMPMVEPYVKKDCSIFQDDDFSIHYCRYLILISGSRFMVYSRTSKEKTKRSYRGTCPNARVGYST